MIQINSLPAKIINIIEKYKKQNETYEASPLRLFINDKYYYYVYYYPDAPLVIREDGVVPHISEAQPVINCASALLGLHEIFYGVAERVANKEHLIKNHNRIIELLNLFSKELNLDSDSLEQLNDFKKVSELMIETQNSIKQCVENAKKLMKETVKQNCVDQTAFNELLNLRKQFIYLVIQQNEAQVNSFNSRKVLMKKLSKMIPVYKGKLWLKYIELRDYHSRMLKKYDREDLKLKKRYESIIFEDHEIDEDKRFLQKLYDACKNPR